MHYFHLTREQEDLTGYENPISIDRYAELCQNFDFDEHEYESLMDDFRIDDEEKAFLSERYGKALDCREALLALIAIENSEIIARYFADEIVCKFEALLDSRTRLQPSK